jgi:hypothetical protein
MIRFLGSSWQQVLFVVFAAVLSSCTYGVPARAPVHLVPALEAEAVDKFAPPVSLKIDQFLDARDLPIKPDPEAETLVVQAEGAIGELVKSTLEKFIRARNMGGILKDTPSLSGLVREWRVEIIRGGLSLELKAIAAVDVTLRGPRDEVLYTSHYVGSTTTRELYPRERRLTQVLSNAMAEALHQLIQDKQLNERIAVASQGGYRAQGS